MGISLKEYIHILVSDLGGYILYLDTLYLDTFFNETEMYLDTFVNFSM